MPRVVLPLLLVSLAASAAATPTQEDLRRAAVDICLPVAAGEASLRDAAFIARNGYKSVTREVEAAAGQATPKHGSPQGVQKGTGSGLIVVLAWPSAGRCTVTVDQEAAVAHAGFADFLASSGSFQEDRAAAANAELQARAFEGQYKDRGAAIFTARVNQPGGPTRLSIIVGVLPKS